MIFSSRIRAWLNWHVIRAHLFTCAVALSFNSTWRVPRDAARYGALPYLIVYTAAMVLVALPTALLQLAVSHLSQQDAVGVWRAVPFFKGVGYLRLLASLLGAVHTVAYVALTGTVFLYSLRYSIPFWECTQYIVTEEGYENLFNATDCLEVTFLAPASQRPESYAAVALVAVVIWILLPFLLYSPVKAMRRLFHFLGPAILILGITIVSGAGDPSALVPVTSLEEWGSLAEPHVWQAALTQALLSSQIGGGFLVSVGDVVYPSTNVQSTAYTFVGTNLVASYASVIFWRAVSGERDATLVAALVYAYDIAESRGVAVAWSIVAFVLLLMSGVVTLLTLLHPVYDHIKRVGGRRWRVTCVGLSVACVPATLAALAGRLPALGLLDDVAVPLLVALATAVESLAFIFIYGWKTLAEDVEFLTSSLLSRPWVVGWFITPALLLPCLGWWVATLLKSDDEWSQQPWVAAATLATLVLIALVVVGFAVLSVARQVQYDVCSKLKSSFTPSRHWGPRDPITHYYWLARRQELARGERGASALAPRLSQWRLGQLSAGNSLFSIQSALAKSAQLAIVDKPRANSDDIFWTGYRRDHIAENIENIRRSRSLDWAEVTRSLSQIQHHKIKLQGSVESTPTPADLAELEDTVVTHY